MATGDYHGEVGLQMKNTEEYRRATGGGRGVTMEGYFISEEDWKYIHGVYHGEGGLVAGEEDRRIQ